MNWIEPVLRISLALVMGPQEAVINDSSMFYTTLPEQIFVVDTTVGVRLFDGILGIEGDALVYTVPPWAEEDATYFAPFQSDFYFRTYLQLGPVQAGWEHLCTHPTLSMGENWDRRYGGKNSIYLTYEYEGD